MLILTGLNSAAAPSAAPMMRRNAAAGAVPFRLLLCFLAVAAGALGQGTTLQALTVTYPTGGSKITCYANAGAQAAFITTLNTEMDTAGFGVTCQNNPAAADVWILEKDAGDLDTLNSIAADPGYQFTGTGGDSNFKAVLNSVRVNTILASDGNGGNESPGAAGAPFYARDFSPFNCGLGTAVANGNKQFTLVAERVADASTYAICSASAVGYDIGLAREEVVGQPTRRQIQWPLRDDGGNQAGAGSEFWEWTARMVHWVSDSNDAPTIDAGTVVIASETRNDVHVSAPRSTTQLLDNGNINWADQDAGMGYCVYKTLVVTGGTVQNGGSWRMDPAGAGSFADFDVTAYSDGSALIVEPGTRFRYSSDGTAGTATLTFRAYDGTEYGYDANTAVKQTTINTSGKRGGKYPTSSSAGTLSYTVIAPPATTGTPAPVTTGTPAPATTGTPTPVTTGAPAPVTTGIPAPVTTGAPAPATTGAPAPATTGGPAPATTGSAATATTNSSATSTTSGSTTAVSSASASSASAGSTSGVVTSSSPTTSTGGGSGTTGADDQVSETTSTGGGIMDFLIYIIIAGVVLLCLVLGVVLFFVFKRRKGEEEGEQRASRREMAMESDSSLSSSSEDPDEEEVIVYGNIKDAIADSEGTPPASSSSDEVVYGKVTDFQENESSSADSGGGWSSSSGEEVI